MKDETRDEIREYRLARRLVYAGYALLAFFVFEIALGMVTGRAWLAGLAVAAACLSHVALDMNRRRARYLSGRLRPPPD